MANNKIDSQGITIQTIADILNDIINGSPSVPGLKAIYGSDINVDQNSPDGQMINIFALSKQDILDLILQDYSSKDPDQAVGVALDAVAQLCGITRQGGTYTKVAVVITTDRNLNLVGMDVLGGIPFTVADSNGNQFQLIASASLTTGDNTLLFQAVSIGAVQVVTNSITVPVTIVLGVLGANNPNPPIQNGLNEETDAQFRMRRQKSISTPSQGFSSGLLGGLLNLPNVASALVLENISAVTDGDGIPAHSIWVIVDGDNQDSIAQLIYNYRSAGCGMKGSVSVPVLQIDGSLFNVLFDVAGTQDLYVRFHLDSINGSVIDDTAIAAALAAQYLFSLNQPADVTSLSAIISGINPNLVVSSAAVSNDGAAFANVVFPLSKKNKFVLRTQNISFI